MANPDHVELVRQGTEAIEQWRTENRGLRLDLRKAELRRRLLRQAQLAGADLQLADLRGCDLRAANLAGADLRGANLRGANLAAADLSRANLSEANLSETNLTQALLSGTLLTRADLRGTQLAAADLQRANLTGADLRGADLRSGLVRGAEFSQALVGWTGFGDLDLSAAKSLETLQHEGPSTVGVDTLYKSKGKIAGAFLTGCGVPPRLQERLAGTGVQETAVADAYFVSSSESDQSFCQHLCTRLREVQLRVWPVLEHAKPPAIGRGPACADKLIHVFTEASLGTEWLTTEVYLTRRREQEEGRRILFPVRLVPSERVRAWSCVDPETEEDVAVELREFAIPDFSNWQNEAAVQSSWQRLLNDLAIDQG